MKWEKDAQGEMEKAPFFVRRRVKARVEEVAAAAGRTRVTLEDVVAAKKRFLSKMSDDIKGYQLDGCFGPAGCDNRVIEGRLREKLTDLLERENLLMFLKSKVAGEIRFHHEFKLSVADCPNACSQPQIKDIGIIGVRLPGLSGKPCGRCGACVETCREKAIGLATGDGGPVIDDDRCVGCGRCIAACPDGVITLRREGWRVLLGGRLGRHPRLARALPGLYSEAETLSIVARCLAWYKETSRGGERFADAIARDASLFEELAANPPSASSNRRFMK